MYNIIIQIKDKDGVEYRTLIEGPDNYYEASDLLPDFVRAALENWEDKAPCSGRSHGEKIKDSMIIEWKNLRFVFQDIFWD